MIHTYDLGEQHGHRFIVCRVCNMKSFNPNDIRERYCGNCHEFHEHMRARRRIEAANLASRAALDELVKQSGN